MLGPVLHFPSLTISRAVPYYFSGALFQSLTLSYYESRQICSCVISLCTTIPFYYSNSTYLLLLLLPTFPTNFIMTVHSFPYCPLYIHDCTVYQISAFVTHRSIGKRVHIFCSTNHIHARDTSNLCFVLTRYIVVSYCSLCSDVSNATLPMLPYSPWRPRSEYALVI